MRVPSDSEKQAIWQAYHDRRPTRVPVRWNTNPRIVLLDHALNPEGYTFEQYSRDPLALMTVQARCQEYRATVLNRTCDAPCEPPAEWTFYVDNQNTYDGAYFGTPLEFAPGQCPSNRPCLTADDLDEFVCRDFSRPLENPWLRGRIEFHDALSRAARDFTYASRRGKVVPLHMGFDGPLTVAAVLMGGEIFELLAAAPDKACRFMETLVRAALVRNRALAERNGGTWKKPDWGWTADDSIQLISTAMYEERILPLHELYYSSASDTTPASKRRSIHLCGDATRHFPLIHERLGVVSFDTGYPVDHGALRRALGPDVEIAGGPPVHLLHGGTPAACADAARTILCSGVTTGGRFILQEANNLPPCTPMENLAAVYETCLECGRHERGRTPRGGSSR